MYHNNLLKSSDDWTLIYVASVGNYHLRVENEMRE